VQNISYFFCFVCYIFLYWFPIQHLLQRECNTKILSLVIHREILKKKPSKKYISIQRGMNLRKPLILVVNWVSWAPPLLLHIFWLLLTVQLL
jgi:hypothetical protein